MRSRRPTLHLFVVALVAASGALMSSGERVGARPLTMAEIFELSEYLDCKLSCASELPAGDAGYLAHAAYHGCLQEERCGVCVPGGGGTDVCGPPRLWEKNGVDPVDGDDLELALLEYQHQTSEPAELVCYRDAEETIVVPGGLCGGPLCTALTCTEDDCSAAAPPACPQGQSAEGTDLCCEEKPGPGGTTEKVCWHAGTGGPTHCTPVVCDHKAQVEADGATLISDARPCRARCLRWRRLPQDAATRSRSGSRGRWSAGASWTLSMPSWTLPQPRRAVWATPPPSRRCAQAEPMRARSAWRGLIVRTTTRRAAPRSRRAASRSATWRRSPPDWTTPWPSGTDGSSPGDAGAQASWRSRAEPGRSPPLRLTETRLSP